jgi:hypothetical protein
MSALANSKRLRSPFDRLILNNHPQVNVMMGVGLLSLPFALKSSGWVGLGLLWLMGLVTNYTGVQEGGTRQLVQDLYHRQHPSAAQISLQRA